MALEAEKTAVVLLGAGSFPKSSNFQESIAFSEAKDRIVTYFQNGLGVKQSHLLDLFDSEASADDQDSQLNMFINAKVGEGIQDLFVYYVGHGSFTPIESSFFLAIKSTRDNNPGISSITIRTLANTLVNAARNIRTFIILDCCFAAAAGTGFMSDAQQVPAIHLKDAFTSKGLALLCATSKDLPALIVSERKITMFTEGLDLALRKGDSAIRNKYLSLRQIHDLTYSHIKLNNPGNDVRPEIISALQVEGDIADLLHFENFGYEDAKYDILAKKREIEGEMIKNNFANIGTHFIDFVRNFDQDESYNNDSIILCSECYELLEDKKTLAPELYKERKINLYKEILSIIDKIFLQNINLN